MQGLIVKLCTNLGLYFKYKNSMCNKVINSNTGFSDPLIRNKRSNLNRYLEISL